MKKTILVLLASTAIVVQADQRPLTCGEFYQRRVAKTETDKDKPFFDLTSHMYSKKMYEEMVVDTASAVASAPIMLIGLPVLLLLDIGANVYSAFDNSYWAEMDAFVNNGDAKLAEKALRRMHSTVKNDFEISKDDLRQLVREQGSDWFCNYGSDTDFSEAGKQLMGDQDMMLFAYKNAGKTEEWRRLFDNPDNFKHVRTVAKLDEDALEEKLFALLDTQNVPRALPPAANWSQKSTRIVDDSSGRR